MKAGPHDDQYPIRVQAVCRNGADRDNLAGKLLNTRKEMEG